MADSFSITKTPNTSESVTLNYPHMGLTSLRMDTYNSWVTATCSRATSPNVTYTNTNNVTTNYYASRLWIVGGATGSSHPLHQFSGYPTTVFPQGSPTAELIIQNNTEDQESTIYTCFLLNYVGTNAPPGSQIDNMFNVISSNQTEVTVDLNTDIFRTGDQDAKYIQYTSENIGSGTNVIIYSQPLDIGATAVELLQNNLGLFDMYNSNYNILIPATPGDWMECDYVPIDSEEVASYNLPLVSGVIADSNAQNSMQTIMMFIVFSILTAFAYMLIPSIYLYIIRILLGNGYSGPQQKKDTIFKFDMWSSILFCGIAVILIGFGAFGNSDNAGTLLSTGLTMSIYYLLTYVIIQSKKTDENFLRSV